MYSALVFALAFALADPASAQPATEADKLNAEVVRLYRAGKFLEAIPLAKRALALREKALGPEHQDVGPLLNNLAGLYRAQGRYAEAEALSKRNLALREKALGPEHPLVGQALNNLAELYRAQGRLAEAEPLYKRTILILQKVLGPEHSDVGTALNNLALLYHDQGRYAAAEPLYKRGLAIREKALGPEHPDVGQSLNNLAELYREQRRYAAAEPLFKRDLAISEKALGPEHPDVGTSLNNLAELYRAQGRYAEAEALSKRSLTIREKALGPEHPDVAQSLNNLAELYRAQGRYAAAESLYERSLGLWEKALGPDHPSVARSLNNLAGLYESQGRYAEAEPLYTRSLALREKGSGPEHPDVALLLNNLAAFDLARGNLAGAADHWHRATAILQRRAERGLSGAEGGASKREAQRNGWYFDGLIKTTHRIATEVRIEAKPLASEMFEIAQWSQASEAAASLSQMAARSAVASPELGDLVRERQDLVVEWQGGDKQLIARRSDPPAKRNAPAENALTERLAAIDLRLATIDTRLANEFPEYAALASPRSVAVTDAQAALRDDEALVLILDTDARFKPLPEETFLWVVTRREMRWVRSDLGTGALQREVAALRCGLDATAWHGEGKRRCANLLKLPLDKAPKDNEPLPFDAMRAHLLYRSLFGDVRDLIAGKHLLVVPSGALTTLPFQVLVTKAPTSTDLASASWLIRDHAITVLPSVASLAALRRTGKPSAAPKPMIGFANPLLDGDQEHPKDGAWHKQQARRARAETGCAASPKQRTAALRGVSPTANAVPQRAGLADLAHLRVQTALPETADEVCAVARSIGADAADMRIGARATETEVKRLSETGELAKYRILHFATHGLLAGQLTGTREPGLILTPPATATPQDDGYLSGSEIAALKLNAEWVILSACNTAGGTGVGEAAEALSGLARVFFYAGARALLVSHWEVDSDAAVKLVTGAVGALAKDASIGRAEALRRAMLALMADTTRPQSWVPASHPSVWAPFVVVGEGGAAR